MYFEHIIIIIFGCLLTVAADGQFKGFLLIFEMCSFFVFTETDCLYHILNFSHEPYSVVLIFNLYNKV